MMKQFCQKLQKSWRHLSIFFPLHQPMKSSKMLGDQADILHSQMGVGDSVAKKLTLHIRSHQKLLS